MAGNHRDDGAQAAGDEVIADLRIGPTDRGRVRLHLTGEGFDLPVDFDPDEAEAIAAELRAAAAAARRGRPPGRGRRP